MTLIPEGTWRARAVTAELGYTAADNEQVGVALVFSPDQDPDVDGRPTTWYGSFSEKSLKHTLKALRTCGWAGDNLADLSGIDANEVEVVVAHEDDLEGQPRARAKFINPIGAGGVAMRSKMSEDQARAFAERMRGPVLASTAPPSAAPKPAPARQPKRQPAAAGTPAPDDDNVPF
jgi:hypothetical protein